MSQTRLKTPCEKKKKSCIATSLLNQNRRNLYHVSKLVSVTDSEGPKTYRYQFISLVSVDTEIKINRKL